MKKILFCGLLTVVGVVTTVIQPTFAQTTQGSSSLTITALDEKNPRIYEANNLNFGIQNKGESNTKFQATEDLVIKIFDQRLVPGDWQLQVKIGKLETLDGQQLANPKLSIGEGTFVSDDGAGMQTYNFSSESMQVYQSILSSEAGHSRGWAEYQVPKEKISLSFGEQAASGKYTATNYWRVINAEP
ncbi:hypothetical protein KUA55_15415 [Enterococcus sp. ALS3]|uniref:WxL domain-containing protein n=1 Tax=Enterococcus alishanensis TaxID=1303817 RepID=A0ABS6TGX5_9ENTE|nr:WxL domain-containing protein [Enterococcus alishanensis]MBV7392070.1 hypothetical protein [Enterococcus alishanensis]